MDSDSIFWMRTRYKIPQYLGFDLKQYSIFILNQKHIQFSGMHFVCKLFLVNKYSTCVDSFSCACSFQGLQIGTRELEEMGAQFCVALLRLRRLTGLHNHQHLLDLESDIIGTQTKAVRSVSETNFNNNTALFIMHF